MTDKNIATKLATEQSKPDIFKNNNLPGPGSYDTAYSTFKTEHAHDK